MEKWICIVIPIMMAIVLVRLFLIPMHLAYRLSLHSAGGFLCLWLLNSVSPFTGVLLPINTVTVLTAGFLGLPGIGIITVLALL